MFGIGVGIWIDYRRRRAAGGGLPSAVAPVITSFGASPSAINDTQSSTLSWVVNPGTRACTVTLNGTQVATSGSQVVMPASTTVYTLVATSAAGSVNQAVTLTVTATPTTNYVTDGQGNFMTDGNGNRLTWK